MGSPTDRAGAQTRWRLYPRTGKFHCWLRYWRPVAPGEQIRCALNPVLLYEVAPAEDERRVKVDIEKQLAEIERLAARPPEHLDSHQHVHRNEPVRSIMKTLARRLSVPLRECSLEVHFCGDFYGQTGEGEPLPGALTTENLSKILEGLPEGTTELGCHPGYPEDLESVYRDEREDELRVLCDPAIKEVLRRLQIGLRGFSTTMVRAGPEGNQEQ